MSAGPNLANEVIKPMKSWGGVGPLPPHSVIFGRSQAMLALQQKLAAIAAANVPVLLEGESGSGKEIIAKMIHALSSWHNGAFVKVNCPAIPGTLIESELFGYEKGAFTGAITSKQGRVEMAHRGTLFLDEIGEMDMGLQSKLLQVLQDNEFCRIGGQENQRVEARIVCATNRDLTEEVAKGRFRQDLLHRINVVTLSMPPLRERKEDIPILAEYFLEIFARKFGVSPLPLSDQELRKIDAYDWPGNIRELENLMKRKSILGTLELEQNEQKNAPRSAFSMPDSFDGSFSLKEITKGAVREIEKEAISRMLQATNWNRREAARRLGISYRALIYKIQESGLIESH